jgi:hypothetical protein
MRSLKRHEGGKSHASLCSRTTRYGQLTKYQSQSLSKPPRVDAQPKETVATISAASAAGAFSQWIT